MVNRNSVILAAALASLALSRVTILTFVAASLLFLQAVLLVSSEVVAVTKTQASIASFVVGGYLTLIVVGVVLAPLSLLSFTGIVVVLASIAIGISIRDPKFPRFKMASSSFWILVSLVAGVVVAFWFRSHSPYPLEVDTDVVKTILRADFVAKTGSSPLLINSGLRPVTFEIGIATISNMTGLNPSQVVWLAPFFTYSFFSVGISSLCYRFTKDWPIATVSSLIFLFVCGFWYLSGPQLILPATFVELVNIFVLVLYLDWNPKGLGPLLYLLIAFGVLDFAYFYAVPYILPLVGMLQIWPTRRLGKAGIVAFGEIAFLGLLASLIAYAQTVGAQETVQQQLLTFNVDLLLAAYTGPILLLMVFGSFTTLLWKRRELYPFVFYGLFLLALYFAPVPFANRSETFARPELAMIAGLGIGATASLFGSDKNNRRKAIATAAVLVILIPVVITPYQSWFGGTVSVQGWEGLPISQYSVDEANAGLWLKNHAGSGYVVSDIESSAVLQSLSSLPGLWDPINFLDNLTAVNIVYSSLSAANPALASQEIKTISDHYSEFYFVITSRTAYSVAGWQNSGGVVDAKNVSTLFVYYPVASPMNLHLSVEGSVPVYSNPTVSIYVLYP